MYPYNRKTQLYSLKTCAKESITSPNQNNPLSSDRRLQELLSLAQAEAKQMAEKYAALMNDTSMAESEAILRTMYLDGMKHLRMLREVGFTLFNDTGEPQAETTAPSADNDTLLEELLLAEMDDISFYRDLLFAMEEEDLRNIFFEILTDKQNHTAALNYLYAKYLR